MTGREHVELYASIKGIPKEHVKEAVLAHLRKVGLGAADSDRLSAEYSGGMKRRLSLACALIGEPQILFLDECTTVRTVACCALLLIRHWREITTQLYFAYCSFWLV